MPVNDSEFFGGDAGICDLCEHRQGIDTCAAYPQGIPVEILIGDVDHRQPYAGDRGIVFAATDAQAALEAEERFQAEPVSA